MLKTIVIIFFTSITLSVLGQTNLDNIKADLEYLAADERKGRKTGTPEALESAKYIANQFAAIGLVSPSIANDYLHEFTLVKSENVVRNLTLNNIEVDPDDFVVLSTSKMVKVSDPAKVQIITIGESENFMEKFSVTNGLDNSFMVIVHPIHKNRFQRLKNYLSRPRFTLDSKNDNFSAWILSAEESIDNFDLYALNKTEEIKGYNVIGVLPSEEETGRIWMYSAHYDHLGYLPAVNGDSIANGADDDASGTAAVIELARIFAKEKTSNKPLWFVAFAAEELGLYGSKVLADTFEIDQLEAVINIEMIGKSNDDLGYSSAYISGYDLSYWPVKMSEVIPMEEFMFFPDPYPQMNLFMRSDNASFVKYGIPAHTISTYSENDETYHQVNDDIDKIEFENMKVVIDAIYRASIPLLQLDYDPGKIDYQTKTDR